MGEDAVDTVNRALDKIDESTDIAKDVADPIGTTAKVYQPLRKIDVLKLWQSEVPRTTIIEVIQLRKCGFEISPDEIIEQHEKSGNARSGFQFAGFPPLFPEMNTSRIRSLSRFSFERRSQDSPKVVARPPGRSD